MPRSEKEFIESDLEENAGEPLAPMKTKNEVDVSSNFLSLFPMSLKKTIPSFLQIPLVEVVKGSLPEDAKVIEVGVVQDVLENLVIVQSLGQGSPLDEDTLLCFVDREILGKVFETFGPVLKPLYSVRFNNPGEIDRTRAVKGAKVMYVPEVCVSPFTDFSFPSKDAELTHMSA